MILYFASGLIITYGIYRIFVIALGGGKTHDRLGALINVFFYVIAVFLPFNYIIGVVLFGLGVLFMLSISFEASIPRRLAATAATFAVLIAVRLSLDFANQNIEGLVLFILAALMFYAVSSLAQEVRSAIEKKSQHSQILEMQEKTEEEKNKLTTNFQIEINGIKNDTVQHLASTLKFLDVYKLADVEASIKDLIARNKMEKTQNESDTTP